MYKRKVSKGLDLHEESRVHTFFCEEGKGEFIINPFPFF